MVVVSADELKVVVVTGFKTLTFPDSAFPTTLSSSLLKLAAKSFSLVESCSIPLGVKVGKSLGSLLAAISYST